MLKLDIIVDLQYGDSGKGKVAHFLCTKNHYTHIIRYNGGGNAGHTIYHQGKKFVTHQVPVGVFYGIKSIIGSGCVVDPVMLAKEVQQLEAANITVKGVLYIAKNAHVVTPKNRMEDRGDKKIGTTKQGIGPTYRKKYDRTGVRAESIASLKPYLIDLYKEFKTNTQSVILGEGAQGFGLDIDWGDYPFVTSSHCTVAGALLNGFSPQSVRQVWGIAKVYETYVGGKVFEPKQKIFQKIRELGEEYGATTGRARQCNWLDMDLVEKAVHMNGVTHIVFNKIDILDTLKTWKLRMNGKTFSFDSSQAFKQAIIKKLKLLGLSSKRIYFSGRKDGV
jgi:adenylosuccinate synthase